jgi:hypothetical protein
MFSRLKHNKYQTGNNVKLGIRGIFYGTVVCQNLSEKTEENLGQQLLSCLFSVSVATASLLYFIQLFSLLAGQVSVLHGHPQHMS